MSKWYLDDAIHIVRALQQKVRDFHYHIALGGGVLNKGYSDKDIDLYFLSMNKDGDGNIIEANSKELIKFLSELWGPPEDLFKDYGDGEVSKEIYRHKIKFNRNGNERIDCFIV